jgi:hypothetical protein
MKRGKVLLIKITPHSMRIRNRYLIRIAVPAFLEGLGTTRIKVAPYWRVYWGWHFTAKFYHFTSVLFDGGYGR